MQLEVSGVSRTESHVGVQADDELEARQRHDVAPDKTRKVIRNID